MQIDLRALAQNGFVKFSCDSSTDGTLNIADAIGSVASPAGIPMIQTLMPRKAESVQRSSYSGNFGLGDFPLHTDLAHWHVPPRFFLLRCVQPADHVHTTFVKAAELFRCEDHITLRRSLFRPRRRLDGRLTMLRLYDRGAYRWDELFIQPMNSIASELQTRIASRISNMLVQKVAFESAKDCIVVDNWNVLHGRSAVSGIGRCRVVERVYLSAVHG